MGGMGGMVRLRRLADLVDLVDLGDLARDAHGVATRSAAAWASAPANVSAA